MASDYSSTCSVRAFGILAYFLLSSRPNFVISIQNGPKNLDHLSRRHGSSSDVFLFAPKHA